MNKDAQSRKSVAVCKAFEATWGAAARDTLRDAILEYIAGLPREAVDAAIVELFEEMQVLDDVLMESCGFTRGWD